MVKVRKVIVAPAPGTPVVERRSKWKVALDVVKEYLSSSTIHGLSYLHKEGLTKIERVWWGISIIITMILSFYLIGSTFVKWINNPIVIAFENELRSIYSIPFPAVTICPSTKFNKLKYDYLQNIQKLNSLSPDEYKKLTLMNQLCNSDVYGYKLYCPFNFTDYTLTTDILKAAWKHISRPDFSKVFKIPKNDSQFGWSYVLTEEGYCVSFNTILPQQMFTSEITDLVLYIAPIGHETQNIIWDVEKGYYETANGPGGLGIPIRTMKTGIKGQFEATIIQIEFYSNILCDLLFRGSKVIIHNPGEIPQVKEHYHTVSENAVVTFAIEPNLITTSEKIRSISPEVRKCYFLNERPLTFYKSYSEIKCRAECLANLTLHYCDCVQFYMPKNDDTKICACGRQECAKNVKDKYIKLEMEEKFKNNLNANTKHNKYQEKDMINIYKKCNCLPSCTKLDYKVSISESDSTYTTKHSILEPTYANMATFKEARVAQLNVFFEKSDFVAQQRRELYETVDFIANCASILAVFMGFSFQSLIEILYFATLRLFIKYLQYFTNKNL